MDAETRSDIIDQIRNAPAESEAHIPDEFTITFHRAPEIGGWWINSSIEGVVSQGETLEEAAVMAVDALKLMLDE